MLMCLCVCLDPSAFVEDILSPSGSSPKSAKRMEDFEGEEGLSDDDELAQIHAHAQYGNPHVASHLSMANMYHMPKCESQVCGHVFTDKQIHAKV